MVVSVPFFWVEVVSDFSHCYSVSFVMYLPLHFVHRLVLFSLNSNAVVEPQNGHGATRSTTVGLLVAFMVSFLLNPAFKRIGMLVEFVAD